MKMKNRVLAVLALALLMINMLPVRVAEAAESNEFQSLIIDELRAYRDENEPLYAYLEAKYYERGVESPYNSIFLIQGVEGDVFTNKSQSSDNENQSFAASAVHQLGEVQGLSNGLSVSDYNGLRSFEIRYLEGNIDFSVYEMYEWITFIDLRPEPEPVTLPVFEPGYKYWLYIYRNESTESIFFANDPFTVAAAEQEGEYTVTLPAGVKVYPVSGYGPYFGREYASGGHVTVKPGDVIRSSHDIQFGDSLVEAWTSGSVSYVPEANSVEYTGELPYVSAFTNYSSGGRAGFDGTKTTYWNCSIEVEGTMPEEAALTKFIVEGKYLMPTRAYFDMCREKDIEPDYLEWKDMYYKTAILKEANYDDYYTIIDYRDEVDYNERLICLETSNYILEMKESGALFEIYKTDVGTDHSETYIVENFVYKPFLEKIKSFMTPLEVRVTAKCVVDMDVCYGKTYTTQMFHHIAPEFPDINAIVENYYDLENREEVVKESLVGALQTQTSEHYQNLLADMQQKLNDAEIKISTLEQTLAVGDEGDLFGTFSSVANGLSGLSGSFRNISAAVGNVFAFFPEEITGLLFAGIVVMIVIAVYKALRG